MYSLSEILSDATPEYLRYLSQKTGFLINPLDKTCQHWFWLHIIHSLNHEIFPLSDKNEFHAFDVMLSSCCIIGKNNRHAEFLEARFSFVFRAPDGNVFIPAEIIKTLMNITLRSDRFYLFQLVHRLRFPEQKNLASLLSRDAEARDSLTFEDHPLDMSLVLYMWYATKFLRLPRMKLLSGNNKGKKKTPDSYPNLNLPVVCQPLPLWQFLENNYAKQAGEIHKFRSLLHRGGKSFYRSVSLLNHEAPGGFARNFISGLWFPIFRGGYGSKSHLDNIRIVTPSEFLFSLQENMDNNQSFPVAELN